MNLWRMVRIGIYFVVATFNSLAFVFGDWDLDKAVIAVLFVALIFGEISDHYRDQADAAARSLIAKLLIGGPR